MNKPKNLIEKFVSTISESVPAPQDIEPDITIKIKENLFGPEDFSALGYYAGEKYPNKKISFIFLSQPNKECITALSASLSIFKVPAFAIGKESENTIEIGFPEIDNVFRKFNPELDPDLIWLGCPRASKNEVIKIASILNGRKINKKLAFWVFTTDKIIKDIELEGYEDMIEKAGGKLITAAPPKDLSFKCIGTNSARVAHYARSLCNIEAKLASLGDIVEYALR